MKRSTTLLVMFILITQTVIGKPAILDSLKTAFLLPTEQDSKSHLLEELITQYIEIDIDSALYYSDVLKSSLTKESKSECKYYQLLGQIYKKQHNLVLFQEQYLKALECFQTDDNAKEVAKSKMELGIAYAYQGKISEAKSQFQVSRKLFLQLGDELEAVNCSMHLGTLNIMLEERAAGLDSYFVAYKYFEKTKNYKQLGKVCNNIGLVYSSYGSSDPLGINIDEELTKQYLEKALEFFQKGLQFSEYDTVDENNSYTLIKSHILANTAAVYIKKQDYDISLGYLTKGIKIAKEINSDYSVAIFYHDIAFCHERLDKNYLALDAVNMAIPLLEKMNAVDQLVRTLDLKATVLMKLSHYDQAHSSCKKCYEISKQTETLDIQKIALDCISKTSNSLKIYKDAYLYQKEYIAVNDSIQVINGKEKLLAVERQNEFEKDKALLEQSNEMSQVLLKKERANSRIYLLVSALSLLGLGLLGFIYFLAKKHTKRIEEQNLIIENANNDLATANQKLNNFTSVAAHDLKSPLRTISTYSQLLKMRNKDLPTKDLEMLGFVSSSSRQLSNMIDDLLAFSKIDDGLGPANVVKVEDVIEQVKTNLTSVIEEENVNIIVSDEMHEVKAHKNLLTQLFQNLVANGIKFRKKDSLSVIKIATESVDEDKVTYSISDNGIGIEPEYFDKIFSIFKRLHGSESYEGSGIGLATCKSILDHYGQKIWLKSEVGQGTSFYFTLPKA